ncbi:hypothetical protein [Microbacterium amylolyticum]|uniref:Uncharacterized protein n=1 Tax=Microbacterium amylolyticum TaxID=936337 RepID=A0ABS4ZI31_9MICO|nr:hypothetical protein [Microbacterium amylolyticum]MBP2436673.1 hypothetical protein [Microbacterium amylolyticum]
MHTYGQGSWLLVRDIAKTAEKPLWMSEVEGDYDTSGQGFNLTNIDNGLGMAQHIVDDLRELEPDAWVFWQPVEDTYNMEFTEKLNWGSIFIDFDCDADGFSARRIADGATGDDAACQVLTNAKFNAVRNFTHFIEPGDRLIPAGDQNTTAALPATGGGVTLVHVNHNEQPREVVIDLAGFGHIASDATVTPFTTTESPADDVTANALVPGDAIPVDTESASVTVTVPAKSVTSFEVAGTSGVSDEAPAFVDGQELQLIGVQSQLALAGDTGGVTIQAPSDLHETDAAQSWRVESIDGEGTNRHRVALTNRPTPRSRRNPPSRPTPQNRASRPNLVSPPNRGNPRTPPNREKPERPPRVRPHPTVTSSRPQAVRPASHL